MSELYDKSLWKLELDRALAVGKWRALTKEEISALLEES